MARIKTPLATLLTDFGDRDGYVAAVKGVILSRRPECNIVDITHKIPPHDVVAASYVLAQAAPYFPPDTVHMVVVDPGVGTDRSILAARFSGQNFIFPDNGVISMVASRLNLEELAIVSNTRSLSGSVGRTFHGRDIFAPAAARILSGSTINSLGPKPGTYKLLDIAEPAAEGGVISGRIIYVDTFGNLVSNISEGTIRENIARVGETKVSCGDRDDIVTVATYGQGQADQPLALINSMGLLEVAVNQGRAADVLRAGVGDEMRVSMKEK